MPRLPDPDQAGVQCTWRVENGSALRIYVVKPDDALVTLGASVNLITDAYPEYDGEYIVESKVDYDYVNTVALITTCIGTAFAQEV